MENLGQEANPNPVVHPVNPQNPPPGEVITSSSVTVGSKNNGSKFSIFVIIGIIVILLIYAGVAYLYFQNQKLKNTAQGNENNTVSDDLISPTPTFSSEFVKIVNGNVVYEDPNSEARVLVNKDSFSSTGITGFAKTAVSPDNSKICFESWPPAPTLAIFLANSDGSSVSEVSRNMKNCLWTSDSNKILYINISGIDSISNIYLYTIETKEERNLTAESQLQNEKIRFEIVGLSGDPNKLICKFENLGDDSNSGQCEIDLTTFEISYI